MRAMSAIAMLVVTPFLFGADGQAARASSAAEIECEWKGLKRGTKEIEVRLLDRRLSSPTSQ